MPTIDMQTMRYINLLDRVSRVKTTKCFIYNNTIVFAVPERFVSQAIGNNAENIRYLQEQFGKRIRIVAEPNGIEEAQKFISSVINPIKFKSLEVKDGILIISAGGTQNKASLMGRDKKRLGELEQIVKDVFNLGVKII